MNTTDNLLPCPFCGSKNVRVCNLIEEDPELELAGLTKDNWNVLCNDCYALGGTRRTADESIEAWNRRYEPPNEPLTLDGLKQMEGEPVYIEDIENNGETSCWAIVGKYDADGIDLIDKYCDKNYVDYGSFNLYGKTWLAYRRKPERKEK